MATKSKAGEIRVRRAARADVAQLPELCRQLGYPSAEADVLARFEKVEDSPEHALFVAEDAGGRIAGFADVFVLRTIESEPRAEIAGLVVNEEHRSRGVGGMLMEQVEEWARERKCGVVSLRSNVLREAAHGFYGRLGYKCVKTQKAFRKELGGGLKA